MRVCSFCGENNEDWMEICQRCGNSLVNPSNNTNYSPNSGVASYKAKGKSKVNNNQNNNNYDMPQYNNYDNSSYGYDMYYNNSYYDNQPMNEGSGVKKSILANVDLKLLLFILIVILVVLLSYTIYSLI